MSSILEKALAHLLNEEHEQAEALFHKFMVQRSRQIHESLRQGEDSVLDENWNEEVTNEEYFTEDDLTDLENTDGEDDAAVDGDVDGMDGDVVDDVDGETVDGMDGMDDMGVDGMDDVDGVDDVDAGMDGMDDMDSPEAQIADLQDQLDKLTAEFEERFGSSDDASGDMDSEFGGEDDVVGDGDDMDVDSDVDGIDAGDDVDAVEDDLGDDMGDDVEGEEDDEFTEDENMDDFADITESIVSELEKVSVSMEDGKELGGKSFEQNKTSPALQKKPNPMADGKPVSVKAAEHKGFERETAPAVKDMKKRRNTRSSATDGRSSVSKEGNGAASINKDFAGKSPNDKSPLAKR